MTQRGPGRAGVWGAVVLFACGAAMAAETAERDAGPGLEVRDGRLYRFGKPFFPVGFLYDAPPEGMARVKEYGANSIHREYSLRDVFPERAGEVSAEGLARIRAWHATAARNDLAFFPLLNGHYIPAWLQRAAGGPPVDAQGRKTGLWFPFSLHDPVYLDALRAYWEAVAREVGADENAALFVSWNEPGYGPDTTPPAMAAFARWLEKRHGSVARAGVALGETWARAEDIAAPLNPAANRRLWRAWMRFHQASFADFFVDQKAHFQRFAPRARFTGKHPVGVLTGDAMHMNDIPRQAAWQEVYGCDAYNGSLTHYRNVMEAARSLSGGGPVITYETSPQKGLPPVKARQGALQLFVQLLGGARGLFYYSFEGDKRFAFINDAAVPVDVRAEITRLFTLARDHQEVFSSPRTPAKIAVLLSGHADLHYGEDADPAARDSHTRRVSQTYDLLRNQHYAVDFIAESQLAERLDRYALLVLPSLSILDADELAAVTAFHARGGRLLAFAGALARDPDFEPVQTPPPVLGLATRGPAPWNRGMMRLVETVDALTPYFRGEITVQGPEIVNAMPMEELIPGYQPGTRVEGRVLAANQDAYGSLLLSNDGQVAYAAFDSLYSGELSRLLGGLLESVWGMPREFTVRRADGSGDTTEVMTAQSLDGDRRVYWIANAGPNPGAWLIAPQDAGQGAPRDLYSGRALPWENGAFRLELPGYGYAVVVVEDTGR